MPIVEQEGYIPHLDHLIPPGISHGHDGDYLGKKRKLIGE